MDGHQRKNHGLKPISGDIHKFSINKIRNQCVTQWAFRLHRAQFRRSRGTSGVSRSHRTNRMTFCCCHFHFLETKLLIFPWAIFFFFFFSIFRCCFLSLLTCQTWLSIRCTIGRCLHGKRWSIVVHRRCSMCRCVRVQMHVWPCNRVYAQCTPLMFEFNERSNWPERNAISVFTRLSSRVYHFHFMITNFVCCRV